MGQYRHRHFNGLNSCCFGQWGMTSEGAGPAWRLLFRGWSFSLQAARTTQFILSCIGSLLSFYLSLILPEQELCLSDLHWWRHIPSSHATCSSPTLKHRLSSFSFSYSQRHTPHTRTVIMPRSNVATSKVFYKGASDDFVVFVDDIGALNNWRNDRSIPLASVVNGWKIFVTHRWVHSCLGLDAIGGE